MDLVWSENSPPELGGVPARTKSEQAGWFQGCILQDVAMGTTPASLRSATPPNLGGEYAPATRYQLP